MNTYLKAIFSHFGHVHLKDLSLLVFKSHYFRSRSKSIAIFFTLSWSPGFFIRESEMGSFFHEFYLSF